MTFFRGAKRWVLVLLVLLGTVLVTRPYSFRYPSDARTAFEPWREKFADIHGTNTFDQVVATLSDRDRAVEDYLSQGVSQGRLGYVVNDALLQTIPDNTTEDITDLTVTVTVPANRVLRVTGQALFHINAPMTLVGLLNEDGADVGVFGLLSFASATVTEGLETLQMGSEIRTPSAGTHTYKLRAQSMGSGTAVVAAASGSQAFILVEDIGPVR